jgi:hypothetical protein
MALQVNDWVEIRSKEEILKTLDKSGCLEGMPFMPQMFQYCGQRFKVYKSAHKTCDPVYTVKSRSVKDTVHLGLRCDGKAHGGCQAGCPLFWKEAWLKPTGGAEIPQAGQEPRPAAQQAQGCTEQDVLKATRLNRTLEEPGINTAYVCQTTELMKFTQPLSWWDPIQYVRDYTSVNTRLIDMLRGSIYVLLGRRGGRRFPPLRKFHDMLQKVIGGPASPMRNGTRPPGQPAPASRLDLKPGELVRIKSHQEILPMIDNLNMHRGLLFDVEMVPFCGGTYRVRSQVERFLDERTGKMRSLKTPAVILDDVWCRSGFSTCRTFCPRSLYSWWREEWLERVGEAGPEPGRVKGGESV